MANSRDQQTSGRDQRQCCSEQWGKNKEKKKKKYIPQWVQTLECCGRCCIVRSLLHFLHWSTKILNIKFVIFILIVLFHFNIYLDNVKVARRGIRSEGNESVVVDRERNIEVVFGWDWHVSEPLCGSCWCADIYKIAINKCILTTLNDRRKERRGKERKKEEKETCDANSTDELVDNILETNSV